MRDQIINIASFEWTDPVGYLRANLAIANSQCSPATDRQAETDRLLLA